MSEITEAEIIAFQQGYTIASGGGWMIASEAREALANIRGPRWKYWHGKREMIERPSIWSQFSNKEPVAEAGASINPLDHEGMK